MDKIIVYDRKKKKIVERKRKIWWDDEMVLGTWYLFLISEQNSTLVYRESKTFIQTCLNLWDTSFCFPQGCHFFQITILLPFLFLSPGPNTFSNLLSFFIFYWIEYPLYSVNSFLCTILVYQNFKSNYIFLN